ncbi:hypothetical protein Tco_0315089 [Tanacetum coccineum]
MLHLPCLTRYPSYLTFELALIYHPLSFHLSSLHDHLNSIPADNVPAGRSSSIHADCVSAGLVLVPADSDRI